MKKQLIKDLKAHEGYNWLAPKDRQLGRSKFGAYLDHLGYKTIGVGHLLLPTDEMKYQGFKLDELTEEQADIILMHDIEKHEKILYRYFNRNGILKENLNKNQLRALINMTFQMGDLKAAGFNKMTLALKDSKFDKAVEEMKDSKWYKVQTPKRAQEVIDIFNIPVEVIMEDEKSRSTEKRSKEELKLTEQPSTMEAILDLILRFFRKE